MPDDDAALYQIVVDQIRGKSLNPDEVPELRLVRWVKPTDWATTQVQCMKEAGYEARTLEGGIAYGEVPADQGAALKRAADLCQGSFPTDPRLNLPLPRDRAQQLYQRYVRTTAPCVRQQGTAVPEPPSFEVWFPGYTAGRPPWDPFMTAFGDPDLMDSLGRACPKDVLDLYPADARG